MSVDDSYIVLTNAANFQSTKLDVLKQMVIFPDENSESIFTPFEVDDKFYAEGQVTQVRLLSGGAHGFSVSEQGWRVDRNPDPSQAQRVGGQLLVLAPACRRHRRRGEVGFFDPTSQSEKAQQILGEIRQAREKAANPQ